MINIKVSVIIPTNRINDKILPKIRNIQKNIDICSHYEIFPEEFLELMKDNISDINHYLELTMNALSKQTYKDFEIVI